MLEWENVSEEFYDYQLLPDSVIPENLRTSSKTGNNDAIIKTRYDMTFYWKHEKPRWIPEISQDFYYRQSNFIITLFKC